MPTPQPSGATSKFGKFNIKLSKREKIAVFGTVAVIAVFILVQAVIAPVFEKRDILRKRLVARQTVYADVLKVQDEYRAMQHYAETSSSRFESRPADFTLFSFLDRLAGETGVKTNISYMRPSSATAGDSGLKLSRVELKLQDVGIKELTAYLHGIETSDNMIVVRRLSINKSGPQNSLLTAIIQAETIETS